MQNIPPAKATLREPIKLKSSGNSCRRGKLWAPPGPKELTFTMRSLKRQRYAVTVFSSILSTTGKISQFSPPRGRDASNRMNDGELITPNPFIYFGFDHLMRNRKIFDKYKTLDDVTSLECIAHMGRPL